MLLAKKFNQHYTVGLKYADYRADEFGFGPDAEDLKKLWVWFDFNY